MSENNINSKADTQDEEETPEFSDQELSEAISQVENSNLPAKGLIIKCLKCVSTINEFGSIKSRVVGCIKDMYISGGENVYPGEVESSITALEKISEAVVVTVPDEKWGEVDFAFLKTKHAITALELRLFLNDHLSRYKQSHYVQCLKSFPLLPNGKVDRKTLKADALSLIS